MLGDGALKRDSLRDSDIIRHGNASACFDYGALVIVMRIV